MASKRNKLSLEARRRRRRRKDRKVVAEKVAAQHRVARWLEEQAKEGRREAN